MEDELSYQADEMPNMLQVRRIEQLEGLADTSIVEVLYDDHIEAFYDSDEDLDLSDKDNEQNDNNDKEDSKFDNKI